MRGTDQQPGTLFSYVDLESRVRSDHPLRAIRAIVNDALATLAPDFVSLYSKIGRPSIAPERLLGAMLLQAFYSVRSERQLMERLDTDLLFRWFVGLAIDDKVWDATVFSKNRDRLLEGAIAAKFLAAVLSQPRVKKLMSSDHFSVDGTLIEAWASMKSFSPKTVRATSRLPTRAATPRSTSRARNARTKRTPRRPIPKRSFIARGRAWRPGSPISATP
jgi:transposase